jgi:hypothetical protein
MYGGCRQARTCLIREVVEMTADDIGKYTEGLGRTSLRYSAAFTKRHLHSGGLGEAEAAMLEVAGDQYLTFSICLLHRRVQCRVISKITYDNHFKQIPGLISFRRSQANTQQSPLNLPPKLSQYRNYELRIIRHDSQDHGSRVS